MYLGQADTGPTQAEIDNWIAWQAAQPADGFLMGAARTVGEYWKNAGLTEADKEQLAIAALAQADLKKPYFPASEVAPWENPNWPAVTAAWYAEQERQKREYEEYCRTNQCFTIGPGPSTPAPTGGTSPQPIVPTTGITTARTATRDQVIAAFRNTPGANPQPDDAAISYYMGKGVAQLVIDVAAIRKSNPALAAQIDAQRRAMGLPTAGGTATPITPVTTPTIGTGGITTLLLAAAAAYLIGS